MERRFVLFLVLSFAILFGHMALMSRLNHTTENGGEVAAGDKAAEEGPAAPADQPGSEIPEDQPPEKPEDAVAPSEPPEDPKEGVPEEAPAADIPRQWVVLGSADPTDPYRMSVTLDNRGAAVAWIELNSPRYRNLDDRSGYLGQLVMDEAEIDEAIRGKGSPVQIAVPGTPAAKAGLRPGDLIVALTDQKGAVRKIDGPEAFREALKTTKPKKTVTLTVLRDGEEVKLPVQLGRRPLEVIRPEGEDPLSFLLTLQQIDDQVIVRDKTAGNVDVGKELAGLDLWDSNWEVVGDPDQTHVAFRKRVPDRGLEITKTYRLEQVPTESLDDPDYKAYHLVFDVAIRNTSQQPRKIAYQLDGPNGLPTEGAWYAYKVGRSWGAMGLRDVMVCFDKDNGIPSQIGCGSIAKDTFKAGDLPWQDNALDYIGVDAQYFSSILLPQKDDPEVLLPPTVEPSEFWLAESYPLRVGPEMDIQKLANVSCRVVSEAYVLAPQGQANDTLRHRYEIFAGPKQPDVLANYNLNELVYYGWFSYFAKPMSWILHVFYAVVRNYGLAILLLTVLVRGCMFPLSKKQALGAQKMQQLQPEIKKIQEKYKKDMEARTKAQQELFRKHNYNPLSGCLVLFIQLPIFVALYRSLSVDIELRQAPLLGNGIRWCSNLAAPDMLFDWSGFMPEWFTSGQGMFALGPYFNLLPILTIVLFILQQKMFMPPPTDDQTAMQQKIMQYMMIFIGILFFKVASGLCIYFVASSLWGLAERKFLPKHQPAAAPAKPQTRAEAKAKAKLETAAAERDGAAAGKKKKKQRGKK